jgi:hypothetical protein
VKYDFLNPLRMRDVGGLKGSGKFKVKKEVSSWKSRRK